MKTVPNCANAMRTKLKSIHHLIHALKLLADPVEENPKHKTLLHILTLSVKSQSNNNPQAANPNFNSHNKTNKKLIK